MEKETAQSAPASKAGLWTERILTGVVVLFLLFDGITKAIKFAPIVAASVKLGYSESLVAGLGIVLLACTALYVYPRTSVLGAILLTGYLGGAVDCQVRLPGALAFQVLFPVVFAVLMWGGLYLRDGRLRALFPVRTPGQG
jgi:hypothetical protein